MFSTVTTKQITEPIDLAYWIVNLTSAVQFSTGFTTMLASFPSGTQPLCVEVGPHSQLAGPIRQICAAERVSNNYVPTMLRSADCTESLLSALGQLFQLDVKLDLSADSALFPPGKILTDIPLYPWDH